MISRYEWLAKFARERLAALPKQPKPLSILDDPESPPEFVDPNACFKVNTLVKEIQSAMNETILCSPLSRTVFFGFLPRVCVFFLNISIHTRA
jgi:hypothetical protein